MKSKYLILAVGIISVVMISLQLVSCKTKQDQQKEIKIEIEDPENIIVNKNELIGEKSISKKYIIEIVEPGANVDYKIIIIKPENDVDPKMVVINQKESDSVENNNNANSVPEDITSEIKEFIQSVERNQKE